MTASSGARLRALFVVGPALVLIGLVSASCGQAETPAITGGGPPEGGAPVFDQGEGGSRRDAGPAAMCPTSECPRGRATCPGSEFRCDVDLLWDNRNCGVCGNTCGEYRGLRAEAVCVEGQCVLQCLSNVGDDNADCNGFLEDGCEINLAKDKNNCGKCGQICGPNETCHRGQCICGTPESCGVCGNVCPPPPGAPPYPPEWHTAYGCANGECNQIVCEEPFADCNKDIPLPSGDGCETNTHDDPLNCGACGKVCKPGEECSYGECKCPCGSFCFTRLDSDPYHCGACYYRCEAPSSAHTDAVCNQGICEYPCLSGHADCDHLAENGCETNIFDDPENCGGCGIRCDGVDGQACVEGRCTVKECQLQ